MTSSWVMTTTQIELKMKPQNLRPVVLLIISEALQSVKIVQIMIRSLKEILQRKIRKRLAKLLRLSKFHDAILTAMDNLVIPIVKIAMSSITESSGRGPNNVVQNLDQKDFSGNMEITTRITASGRTVLDIDQDKLDETRKVENFYDEDFEALRPNCDQQAHSHHRRSGKLYFVFTRVQIRFIENTSNCFTNEKDRH